MPSPLFLPNLNSVVPRYNLLLANSLNSPDPSPFIHTSLGKNPQTLLIPSLNLSSWILTNETFETVPSGLTLNLLPQISRSSSPWLIIPTMSAQDTHFLTFQYGYFSFSSSSLAPWCHLFPPISLSWLPYLIFNRETIKQWSETSTSLLPNGLIFHDTYFTRCLLSCHSGRNSSTSIPGQSPTSAMGPTISHLPKNFMSAPSIFALLLNNSHQYTIKP